MAAKTKDTELYDRLNALLHTMRCIEEHEPQLCSLLHGLKGGVKPSAKVLGELRGVLDHMPGAAYGDDYEAVLRVVGE